VVAVEARASSGALLVAAAVGAGSVARTEQCDALAGVALAEADVGGGSNCGYGKLMAGVNAASPGEPSAGDASNRFDRSDGGRGLGSRDFAGFPARTRNFCLMPNLEGIV